MKNTTLILKYLYNLERFGIKLGLEEITKLAAALGNPQNNFKCIHIAGTNGKGSVACFLASILQAAGFKVGLYTSPHLIRFNERIKVNDKNINDEKLAELTIFIKQKVEAENIQTTFFEFTTALAFLYFSQQGVDYAVIETGMGGRLDATNIINPELSVITNISLDHTQHLGSTKKLIAREKAGIIKKDSVVITAETDPLIRRIFKEVCDGKKSQFIVLDKELKYQLSSCDFSGQKFVTTGIINNLFEIRMLGEHQLHNASLAILAANLLKIPVAIIKQGLKEAFWSGRLEVIKNRPLIIVDGTHNIAGMKKLVGFLKKQALPKNKILLIGMSKDKEHKEMLRLIIPLFDQIVISQGNYKPAEINLLESIIRPYSKPVFTFADIKEAIKKVQHLATSDDFILITGSLYLVGDVLGHRNLFK